MQVLHTTLSTIKTQGGPGWPRAKEPLQVQEAEHAATKDYEELLRRAGQLSRLCLEGMEDLRNSVILSESHKAMEQARGVARLTLLAFFFLPLSFTTSFFGMNFSELGTRKLSLWIWAAASFPLFVFALGLCFWDTVYHTLRRSIWQE